MTAFLFLAEDYVRDNFDAAISIAFKRVRGFELWQMTNDHVVWARSASYGHRIDVVEITDDELRLLEQESG